MNEVENRKYLECVSWLLKEWLDGDGVTYTQQLAEKAERRVMYLTGHGKGLYPEEYYTTPEEEIPWYEIEEIINIYFEGE